MSDDSGFLGGRDILDGMPSRHAGAILYAIEGRTATLVASSRQALASYVPEKTAAAQEQAFLSAIAHGRDLPVQPSIQDLERFAPEWASLVPPEDNRRAALARKLGEKYRFRRGDIPSIRSNLGLDGEGVRASFEHLFHQPVASLYVSSLPLSQRARWLRSRLANRMERLPPFWTAFSLTLTETVGGSILALPIALSAIGPLPGVGLLVLLGGVNILTIIAIVEAIARNGNMRYGTAYFGTLVSDFLGRPASFVLVPALFVLNVLVLMAFYVGISKSLADVTGISPMLWSIVICLAAVYALRDESLSATVASALMIGAVNILIITILSLLAIGHVELSNLRYIDASLAHGNVANPGMLDLVFGVVLAAYFGHTSAGNAAKVVLRRDPGGRSLLWGNVLAMLTAIALYSLWVISVNGAIPAALLSRETGTALSPLAERIGGPVAILGTIYVILAMGIGSLHISFGLYYQVREVLPAAARKLTRLLAGLSPILVLLAVVEWMFFTNRESFSWLLGVVGVLLLPLLGGVFPVLMLAASRRNGDYSLRLPFRFVGKPVLLTVVYCFYVASLFVYGLVIWADPLQRFAAVGVGVLTLLITYLAIRRGALASRLVIELRVEASDSGERAVISMVDAGRPLAGEWRLAYPGEELTMRGSEIEIPEYKQLVKITGHLLPPSSSQLKIWIHRVTPEGNSLSIPAEVRLASDKVAQDIRLETGTDHAIVPLPSGIHGFEINLR